MPIDSAFQNLIRGNRLPSFLGIRAPEGAVFGPDYSYLQIELGHITNLEGEVVSGGKRGQILALHLPEWASALSPRHFPTLIKVCPELSQLGTIQGIQLLDKGEKADLTLILRKDVAEISVPYLIRAYLMQ